MPRSAVCRSLAATLGHTLRFSDWPEWFTGPNSGLYLAALYTESGQNSWYTRNLPDLGGENQIIMFKSCFPNSDVEGSPTDPPARGRGLTVSNAKAIYNELLTYFATRPDKLLVAITAPPAQDPTYAANARAFDTWLVTEWLKGLVQPNLIPAGQWASLSCLMPSMAGATAVNYGGMT